MLSRSSVMFKYTRGITGSKDICIKSNVQLKRKYKTCVYTKRYYRKYACM